MTMAPFFGRNTGKRPRTVARLTSVALMLAMIVSGSCTRTTPDESAATADAADAATSGPFDRGWPRLYTDDGNEVTLHQPQIEEWQNYTTLIARLAVTVKLKGSDEPVNGVIELRAATVTNHEARLVTLYKPDITDIRFLGTPPDMAAALEAAVRSLPPAKESTELALDRVLAYVERSQAQTEGAAVNLEPPPIFYSDREAILVSFLGEPRFSPIEGTSLEFGLNTNWDVVRDPTTSHVYLLFRDSWLTTDDVMNGSWEPNPELPPDMKNLPNDEVWGRVSKSVPGQPLTSVPKVFVSDTPGEVIITEGRPKFTPIPGTNLSDISNSENTLFYHQIDQQFYFLAAGRWFRAPDLTGPWSAATRSLPADFAAIPKDDPNAEILASVPGTEEADDAVLLASIPTTAVVNRSEANVEVIYDGDPTFEPIETTTVQYAVNTPNDVFKVGSTYYVCHEAVWFTGPSPSGPWAVADSIPKEIYSIPPTSPKYNVTYVYVYDSTPTTVTTGYTSGYNGEVVAAGIVMFGLGMAVASNHHHYYYGYYPPYYWGYGPRPPMPYYGHAHYYAGPHGYGWSAHGPYGGAGYGAKYNPHTGAYSRGGYAYGPGGGAAYRTGYNPNTGAMGAQRGGYNAYESWSRGAVVKGDEWARGGRYSNDQGTMAGFETSKGAAGVGYRGDDGSGYVVQGKNGNIYAGKDGDVYKRGDSGEWSNANRGGASSTANQTRTAPGGSQPSASTRQSGSPGASTGTTARPTTTERPTTTGPKPSTGTTDRKLSGGFASAPTATSRPSGTSPAPAATSNDRSGASTRSAPSSGVQNSLNRDHQARQTGNARTSQRSSSTSRAGRSGGRGRGH